MKLPEKIILLQKLLADEKAYVELLEILHDYSLTYFDGKGLPIRCDQAQMVGMVKEWLCKLILQGEVKL
jgi:hypothetical protein